MVKQFCLLVKKDIKLMISCKFFIMVLCSLILYSCYINFIYAKTDNEPYKIYLYDPMDIVNDKSYNVYDVYSKDSLMEVIDEENNIAVDYSKSTAEIILYETGNKGVDNFKVYLTLAQFSENNIYESELIGSNNHEFKLRKEMACEVMFFEIVAVGFIGIASILFKEKQMGVMHVYGVMPIKRDLFIISKLFVFLMSDIIFAFGLILINIGISQTVSIFFKVLPHITVLSIIMILLGFFFVMLYKNFKQFGFAYAFIIILMTSPIYLAANTPITWNWINYYPIYHLFMFMKNAFFGINSNSLFYFLICIAAIVILFKIDNKMMKKELTEG